jgi:hypothetical protein
MHEVISKEKARALAVEARKGAQPTLSPADTPPQNFYGVNQREMENWWWFIETAGSPQRVGGDVYVGVHKASGRVISQRTGE